MKTLLQKEVRENLSLAALGLAIVALLLVVPWLVYEDALRDLVSGRGSGGAYLEKLLPLASPDFLLGAGFFCSIFGGVLGFMQMHHERHLDLWAFLVHRPITRGQLFLGKTLAGLGLYSAVAGLPLACFVGWAWRPGDMAAPFDPAMLEPVAVLFLNGMIFYFAGMLTGLRQARWYASRILPVGAAMLVAMGIINALLFWKAMLVAGVSLGLFGAAAWGVFQSGGQSRGQPLVGHAALTAVLALGAAVVAFLALALILPWLARRGPSVPWSSYLMAKDGTIYKSTQPAQGPQQILDLAGKPCLDPKTGRPIEPANFNRLASRNYSVWIDPEKKEFRLPTYMHAMRLVQLRQAGPDTIWYYWARYGRLVGYDLRTRRMIGSLGPDGFAANLPVRGPRFDQVISQVLVTSEAVYQADLERRAIRALFTTGREDPIVGAQEVWLDDAGWQYTLVVTRQFVHLLALNGTTVWKMPLPASYAKGSHVQVSFLEPPGRFALWFHPADDLLRKGDTLRTVHVAWLDRDQGVLKSVDLPSLARGQEVYHFADKVMIVFVPAAVDLGASWLDGPRGWPPIPLKPLLVNCAIAALLWVPAGWWLGQRYGFTLGSRIGWAAFHLLFGLPGFLAFLCVQDWPAREACPKCNRVRVVDLPHCGHCGASFAPPEKTGTEIFEPLVAS
jgi:hypothetical protein